MSLPIRLLTLVAVVLVLQLATVEPAYALDRHTPGFPSTTLDEILSRLGLDHGLADVLEKLFEATASGALSDADIAQTVSKVLGSEPSDEDLVKTFALLDKLHGYSYTSAPISADILREILTHIGDETLRKRVGELISSYEAGTVTTNDIDNLMNELMKYASSPWANAEDVLAAAEIAHLIGRSIGYSEVNSLTNKILELLSSTKGVNLDSSMDISKIFDIFRKSSGVSMPVEGAGALGIGVDLFSNLVPRGAGAPSIGIAFPAVSLPHLDLSTVVYPLMLIAALVCALLLAKLVPRSLPRLRERLGLKRYTVPVAVDELSGVRAAIRNYWAAVRYIASRYGIARHPWETHREYLLKTDKIEMRETFSELTHIYELARYAQAESLDIDEKSELCLREIVGGR